MAWNADGEPDGRREMRRVAELKGRWEVRWVARPEARQEVRREVPRVLRQRGGLSSWIRRGQLAFLLTAALGASVLPGFASPEASAAVADQGGRLVAVAGGAGGAAHAGVSDSGAGGVAPAGVGDSGA
ncbi:MAG: hypothetical protein KAY24_09280, partial [Candidatus Eisenbacteria sp.]|nr:hypothetical protein [Candidatus Eisenbacteria bacterium]